MVSGAVNEENRLTLRRGKAVVGGSRGVGRETTGDKMGDEDSRYESLRCTFTPVRRGQKDTDRTR